MLISAGSCDIMSMRKISRAVWSGAPDRLKKYREVLGHVTLDGGTDPVDFYYFVFCLCGTGHLYGNP